MDKFEVIFYEKANGDTPVESFLDNLDIKMRNKLLMILKVLQEKGNQLRAKRYRKDYIERFGK